VLRAHSLTELVRLGTMSGQCARFLEAAVVTGLNIVVAGATQSGKTTTLNCLAAAIPPRERVITCEEVFELQVGLPDTVAMQTRQPNLEGEGEIASAASSRRRFGCGPTGCSSVRSARRSASTS
jgi:pilus assembly protein CpaF